MNNQFSMVFLTFTEAWKWVQEQKKEHPNTFKSIGEPYQKYADSVVLVDVVRNPENNRISR